jgi:hypothetical protein
MDCAGSGRSLAVHLLNVDGCAESYSEGGDGLMLLPSKVLKTIFLILAAMLLWPGQAAAAGQDYQALSLVDSGLHY